MYDGARIQKTVAILCFISLTASLLIAHGSPTTSYELSFYDATPSQFWFFLFFGILGGMGILLFQIVTKGYGHSKLWITGLIILLFGRASLLLAPYIRGYVSWQGDNISHLGLVKDIVVDGHITTTNSYPITHILLSETIIITDIEARLLSNVSTALISILFVLLTYLLSTAIFHDRGQQLLATLVAGGIFVGGSYNVFLMPNGWSIFILPLLYYTYFNREILPFKILFIIMLIICPFFHPLSALLVILSLIILESLKWFYAKFDKGPSVGDRAIIKYSFEPITISLVCFLPWILSFRFFQSNLNIMWQQITTGIGPDTIGEMGDKLSKVQIQGFDFIVLAIKMYGMIAILAIISLIGFILIIREIRTGANRGNKSNIMQLYVIFIAFCALYALYILGFPGSGAIAGERVLNYFVILMPCLSAFTLYKLLNNRSIRRAIPIVACSIMILTLSILSINILYPSPYGVQPNPQITQEDMIGMSWFIHEKDLSIDSSYIMSPPFRFADAILGSAASNDRTDLGRYMAEQIPDHFGRVDNGTADGIMQHNQIRSGYFAITEFDRTIYSTVWKDVNRFNSNDFDSLKWDTSVSRLYTNKGVDVHYKGT